MSDPNTQEARNALYQQLRKANPEGDRQMLKQLAYDTTKEAVKNLNDGRESAVCELVACAPGEDGQVLTIEEHFYNG